MSSEVILDARKQWINVIVVYIVGPKPYYLYLKDYIIGVWKSVKDFSIYYMENNFYVIRFNKEQDRVNVLEGDPTIVTKN